MSRVREILEVSLKSTQLFIPRGCIHSRTSAQKNDKVFNNFTKQSDKTTEMQGVADCENMTIKDIKQ